LRRRRLTAAALAVLAAAVLAILLAGGSGAPRAKARSAVATVAASANPAAAATVASSASSAPAVPLHRHPHAPSPGSLPQTGALPSGSSAHFRSLMADLWAGVVRGSVAPAMPAFFPKGAYVQLKAVGAPGADWSDRLVHDYSLDIGAAHELLGADASSAALVAVHVPESYAHWVPPGVCYNTVGYYELPNARVVYRQHGHLSSFGIASLISWRGVWYVVHLGAILREGDSGVLDEPSSGSGSSAYSGTC